MSGSGLDGRALASGFHPTLQRASVVTLRYRDGLINLAGGGAVPDDLHLRGAVLPKKPPTALTRDAPINLARGGAAPDDLPITPEGQGRFNRGVKRCAIRKATRLIQWGIDPGFIHSEGRNSLPEIRRFSGASQQVVCLGAYLICRRLCGGDLSELQIHSGDQFSTQNLNVALVSQLPLAPCRRGTLRNSRVRGRPSRANQHAHLGFSPPPLKGRGREEVSGSGIPEHQIPHPTSPALQKRFRPTVKASSGQP